MNIVIKRVLISVIGMLIVFSLVRSTSEMLFDDFAVAALNDADASRAMVVNENLRSIYNMLPIGVMIGLGYWVYSGYRKNKN